MGNTLADKRRAAFAAASTRTLIESLIMLDAQPTRDEAERLASAWISDELERRTPGLDAYLDASFENLDDERSYAQRIVDSGLVR